MAASSVSEAEILNWLCDVVVPKLLERGGRARLTFPSGIAFDFEGPKPEDQPTLVPIDVVGHLGTTFDG